VFVLVITRIVQRWLETELLPHTRIEPSLPLSINTIFGYLGTTTDRDRFRPAEDRFDRRRAGGPASGSGSSLSCRISCPA
jgi:hypothetical protein